MKSLAAESTILDDSTEVAHSSLTSPHTPWRVRVGGTLANVAGRMRIGDGMLRRVKDMVAMVAEAMAVGLMRKRDVEEMVTQTYHSRPEFYDPNRYDLPYEQGMLPTLQKLKPNGSLLDAFCGQGREAKLFSESGYQVTAVDQLDWMIEAARQYSVLEGFKADFLVDDFEQMAVSKPFDVVYTSCWMYSTVQGSEKRNAFLTQCYRLCHEKGVIVISHLGQSSDSVWGCRARYLIAKVTALCTFGNLSTEMGERIYTGLFWHHLSDETVQREIREAGMRVVDRVIGQGMEPTFLFLVPQADGAASGESEAR